MIDSTDSVVGNSTNYSYGLNNRFYAKRRIGTISQAQEILTVELGSRTTPTPDRRSTTRATSAPTTPSPALLADRAVGAHQSSTRVQHDVSRRDRQPVPRVQDDLVWRPAITGRTRSQSTIGWTRRYFIEQVPGFNDPDLLDHYLNFDTRLSTADNRFGTSYSLNYDVLQSRFTQQRITASTTRSAAASPSSISGTTTRRRRTVPGRQPVLHVVHAGRSRQLLAVQRSAREHPALDPCARHTRHRRRRLRRQPSSRAAGAAERGTPGRLAAAAGRLGSADCELDRSVGISRRVAGRRPARQRRCRTGARGRAAGRRLPLRRRRPRRAVVAVDGADLRDQRPRHAPSRSKACARPAARRPRADPELGDGLRSRG